ncbi:MAG: DUF5911 domain-containing protein, partial [Actinomycetota bacterium]|nr:DUF5911 domain-containing protein [Actinomycetota bacterium]
MSTPIEDYGFIGDTETGALVSRQGSIDWLCLPRFDSGACLAALLGDQSHGRWLLGPASGASSVRRRYRDETLILETEFEDESGSVRVVDLMPPRARQPDLVRVVEGLRGRVPMRTHLTLRFDYGAAVPWVHPIEGGLLAVAGPDAIRLQAPVELLHEDSEVTGEFTVAEGQRVPLVLSWHPSYESAPAPIDGLAALEQTEKWWQAWAEPCTYDGQWP